jgi:uncharacterized membrane-anchored protein YjiN (DUF445 family)
MEGCRVKDLREIDVIKKEQKRQEKRMKVSEEMSKKIGKKVRKELKIKGTNSIIRDILTIYSNTMFKTQLYLPNKANEMLDKLAKKIGSSKSELVRKAVDEFLQKYDKTKLKEAYGIWKDYEIDLRGMRDDWKR